MLEPLFKQDHLMIESRVKRKYAKLIIIVVIGYSIWGSITNTYIVSMFIPSSYVYFLLLPIYLIMSTQVTILSFIAYKSLLIRHYLDQKSNCTIDSIYRVVFKIDDSIMKLDRYFSIYVMFTLFTNEIFCVSSICQIAIDYKITIIHSCEFFLNGMFNLVVLCYCCDIIPSSLSKLLDHHEPNVIVPRDRMLMIQLRQLNDRIGFTAFGLFRVKANTFISCLGLIITYSVIIIQTSGQ